MNKSLEPIVAQASVSAQYAETLFRNFATHADTAALIEARLPFPRLSLVAVPARLRLERDRWYIRVSQEGRRWDYPLQLTHSEGVELLPELEQLDWTLSSKGAPENLALLDDLVKHLLGGAA